MTPGMNLSQIKELDGQMKLKMMKEHFGLTNIIEKLKIMDIYVATNNIPKFVADSPFGGHTNISHELK